MAYACLLSNFVKGSRALLDVSSLPNSYLIELCEREDFQSPLSITAEIQSSSLLGRYYWVLISINLPKTFSVYIYLGLLILFDSYLY